MEKKIPSIYFLLTVWKKIKVLGPTAMTQQPFLTYKQKRQRPLQVLQCRPQYEHTMSTMSSTV